MRRAEEILDRCLSKWLGIIGGESEEAGHPMIQTAMKL